MKAKQRRTKTSPEKVAVDYAREELGFREPEAYGRQQDSRVYNTFAVWVEDKIQKPHERRPYKVGLIVFMDELEPRVEDEFDPAVDGEPGSLRSRGN